MQIGIGRQRKTVKEKKREIISGGIKINKSIFEAEGIRAFWHKHLYMKMCFNSKSLRFFFFFFFFFVFAWFNWTKMSQYFQYILFAKRIETFWSRDISALQDIRIFWTISSL